MNGACIKGWNVTLLVSPISTHICYCLKLLHSLMFKLWWYNYISIYAESILLWQLRLGEMVFQLVCFTQSAILTRILAQMPELPHQSWCWSWRLEPNRSQLHLVVSHYVIWLLFAMLSLELMLEMIHCITQQWTKKNNVCFMLDCAHVRFQR